MILTKDNYFDKEMSLKYMSGSQLKTGEDCETKMMYEIEHGSEDNDIFLQGRYMHSILEGAEAKQKFEEKNYEKIMTKTKGLLKPFEQAKTMAEWLKADKICGNMINDEKNRREAIITGVIHGVEFKGMIDLLNIEKRFFVDYKGMANISKLIWDDNTRQKLPFFIKYGYDLSMAIYAELIRQNRKDAEFFTPILMCATKEDPPDKALIRFDSEMISTILESKKEVIQRLQEVKLGLVKPKRCGACSACRATKQITTITYYKDYKGV